jgi:hypothetical protein
LPGLIDAHTHLFLDIVVPPEAEIGRHQNGGFAPGLLLAIVESPSKRTLMGAQLAREDLESGITTVRNLGHSGIDGDTELRDAINAGRVPGPRILASGRKLIAQGSYVQSLNPALSEAILKQEFLLLDGPDRARQAVRRPTNRKKAPYGFSGASHVHTPQDLFLPLSMQPVIFPKETGSLLSDANTWWIQIMGRLQPSISDEEARASLAVSMNQAVRSTMTVPTDRSVPPPFLLPGGQGWNYAAQELEHPMPFLLALAGLGASAGLCECGKPSIGSLLIP